jgi:hypothetical protein
VIARGAERALAAVLVVTAVSCGAYAVIVLLHDWEIVLGESLNAFYIDQVASGESIYLADTATRAAIPIYPPGLFWGAAPLAAIADYALWPGRVVSIAAYAFCALAAARIALRLGCTRLQATASALGLFTFTFAALIVPTARPDGLALAFAAGALWAATAWEDERRRSQLVLVGVASVAMIVTKQNFAPLAVALLVPVAIQGTRLAAKLALGIALGVVAIIAAATLVSGSALIENMRDFGASGYSAEALRGVVTDQLLPFPNPILAVAAVEAILALRAWRTARSASWFWLAGLAVLLSAAKLGSAANYWLPAAFASSVLLGPALKRLATESRAAAAGAAVVLAALLLPQAVDFAGNVRDSRHQLADVEAETEEAVARLGAGAGNVLADRHDLAVSSGGEPNLDAATFAMLERGGRWDPAPAAAAIRARRFRSVQSSFDLMADPIPLYQGVPGWPLALIDAVREGYCPAGSWPTARIWLYEPCSRREAAGSSAAPAPPAPGQGPPRDETT